MRESQIENYLVKRVRGAGGDAYNWVSPSQRGVPDRIILMPGGHTIFVELKAAGRQRNPLQTMMHQRLTELGQHAIVIDSVHQVDELISKFS